MSARILFRDSQGRDGEVVLTANQPFYVGRALDCAIRTDDAMVSRKHSMIRMENGRFFVEDLGSSNGTHVNDIRVTKQFLSHNDVVRCGSLWLRFIEDAPVAGAGAAMPSAGGPRKAGTMRIDPGGATAAASPSGAPGAGMQPAGAAAAGAPGPYGQPLPAGAGFPGAPGAPGPYGGPPAMPSLGAPHAGAPADAAALGIAPTNFEPSSYSEESSVVVDRAAFGVPPEESDRVQRELDRTRAELEALQGNYDREVADGKRLRAEAKTLKDRIEELRRTIQDREEASAAHARVAEELREELRQAGSDLAASRAEISELEENVRARDRQLQRGQNDIAALKQEIEDQKRQLSELSRTKDDGWKKLNEQLGEIDHLREVINQQERMLEERRVGLVSQAEAIKEVRQKEERMLVEMAQLRAERDELRTDASRIQAQLGAIDDENRRLSKLLAAKHSGADGEGDGATTAGLASELKDARVMLRTVESERDQLRDQAEQKQERLTELQKRIAKLEVELREREEQRDKAAAARSVTEDALAKAEVARHKAAEEAIEAARERDGALARAEELKRNLEREQRRITEIEAAPAEPDDEASAALSDLASRNQELTARAEALAARAEALEGEKGRLELALDEARRRLEEQATDPTGARGPEDVETTQIVEEGTNLVALKERALAVHDAINDILSALRESALLVQAEVGEMAGGEAESDSTRIMREATESLVDAAEDAKGALRGLRELVEFGH